MKQALRFFLFVMVLLGIQFKGQSQTDFADNAYAVVAESNHQSIGEIKNAPIEIQINESLKELKKQFTGRDKVTIHFKINSSGQVNGLKVFCPGMSGIKKSTIEKTIREWHYSNKELKANKRIEFSMRL